MGSIWIIILSIFGSIIVLIICREIVCWYYKINILVELMTQQNKLLSEIAKKSLLPSRGISNSENITIVGNKLQKKCKKCKKECDEDYGGCPHCGHNTFE